jgi:hypothetical protein
MLTTDQTRHDEQSEFSYQLEQDVPSEPASAFGENQELAQNLQDAISNLGMPAEPDDGLLADRVSDLILMANTLEHQEGISHVAFNFLVSEICDALGQGLEAGHPDITQRWGQSSSRTYVSKMLRSLSDGEFFLKGNHNWRDETSGQNRRRRTFNLNHEHPLVQQAIAARLGYEATQATAAVNEENSPYSDLDDSLEEPEADGTLDSIESDIAAVIAELPELPTYDEDEDYESGKSAAEARVETGFMSRLFKPRRN